MRCRSPGCGRFIFFGSRNRVRYFAQSPTVRLERRKGQWGPGDGNTNKMQTTIEQRTEKRPQRVAFSVQETASMLGVSDKSVRRLIWRGLLRPSRALRHIRIPKDELERFLRDTR